MRALALLLGFSLVSSPGPQAALHIHAYTDHDHPEHHHGSAVHEHPGAASHHDGDPVSLESCDPGQHAVSIVTGCAPLPHVHVVDAVCASPIADEPLVLLRSIGDLKDVRIHGPPLHTQGPPRAPPLNFPA